MACFSPMTFFRPREGGRLVSSTVKSFGDWDPVILPCGGCIGCRISKQRDWRTRLVHESKLHAFSVFATFSYAPEHFPAGGSVSLDVMQRLMKRIRNTYGSGIRFFASGEYGKQRNRPHYHAILFGLELTDMQLWRRGGRGALYYRSAGLERCWSFGHVEVAPVTPGLCGYVAGYVVKKLGGEMGREARRRFDSLTGESWVVGPEFMTMSTKPGIGSVWYEKFACDAFPSDFVVVEGKRVPVPQYYRRKLGASDALALKGEVSGGRKRVADQPGQVWNNTAARLAVREELAQLKAKAYAGQGEDDQ